ncbi:MAG: DMT family transporter, partial [Exiguobacterium indicum]
MVIGIVCAVLAGMLISLQTVLNARMSDAFGAWATTTLVFFVGFIGASVTYVLF